jgi:putative transposase
MHWYLPHSLSYWDIEGMMAEREFSVDHSTLNRWVLQYSPQLEVAFRRKKKPTGVRWRMDEGFIKVNGQWTYY